MGFVVFRARKGSLMVNIDLEFSRKFEVHIRWAIGVSIIMPGGCLGKLNESVRHDLYVYHSGTRAADAVVLGLWFD